MQRTTTTAAPAVPGDSLDEQLVTEVVQALTRLVGPIAPILVKKVRGQANQFGAFCALLAERLDPKERREFLAAVEAIQKRGAARSPSP
jgi:hypothetical protein